MTRDLFQQGRAVCDGVVGRLRYELRFTWLGGRRLLDRVEARRTRMLIERPTLGAADVPGAPGARAALERAVLMARKTSFYYAFLVLPADQRRAIIAVWDFCRAVDDAVDEPTERIDGSGGRGGGRVLAAGSWPRASTVRRRRRHRAGPATVRHGSSICRDRRSRT